MIIVGTRTLTRTARGAVEGFDEIGAPQTIAAIMIIIYYYEHIY